MSESKKEQEQKVEQVQEKKKPNEIGGILFSSSVKIFDPNTKEIIVQKRGDI